MKQKHSCQSRVVYNDVGAIEKLEQRDFLFNVGHISFAKLKEPNMS